jgi:hypothetical protein
MRTDFLSPNEYDDFLMAEYNTMSGVPAPAQDKFDAGMRIVDSLVDDLALDLLELDMEDFT